MSKKASAQHVEVAEAVMAGDADAAVEAYRRHLEHIRDTTIEVISKSQRLRFQMPEQIAFRMNLYPRHRPLNTASGTTRFSPSWRRR